MIKTGRHSRRNAATRRFFDRWAGKYESTLHEYGYAVPSHIYDALQALGTPGPRLLDLGIGTGLCSHYFRERGQFHITGVDASARMLDLCRAQGIADELVRQDVTREALPLASQSFDVAIAGGLMEFIDDPQELAREIMRLLKPGGIFALTFETPATKDLYPPGFLSGLCEEDDDRVVLQRFLFQGLWPSLYKKYLHSAAAVKAAFLESGGTDIRLTDFVAYRWPGGRDILYTIIAGRRGT